MIKFYLTLPFQFISIIKLLIFIWRIKPDIIHFNINRTLEPVIAARFLKIPTVMHFRDIPSRMNHKFIFGKRSFFKIMNICNIIIANSNATLKDIQQYVKFQTIAIPNAIDLKEF